MQYRRSSGAEVPWKLWGRGLGGGRLPGTEVAVCPSVDYRSMRLPRRLPIGEIVPRLALLCLAGLAAFPAEAQPAPRPKPRPESQQAALSPPAATAQDIAFGPSEAILLRSTLIAINQANTAGDYTIFRRLLTPDLSKDYAGTELAALMKPWRERQRNFGFVAIADPVLDGQPSLNPDGGLRMQGSVPTPSFRLAFDFSFRKVAGRWLIAAFTVSDGTTTTSSRTISNVGSGRMATRAGGTAADSDTLPDPGLAQAATPAAAEPPSPIPTRLPPLPRARPWPLSFDR